MIGTVCCCTRKQTCIIFFPSTLSTLRVNNFALSSRRSTSPRGDDARPMLGCARYLQRADFAFTNGPSVQNAWVYAEMEFAFCAWRQEHGKARLGRWRNWVNVHPEASLEFKCASPFLLPACTYFLLRKTCTSFFLQQSFICNLFPLHAWQENALTMR